MSLTGQVLLAAVLAGLATYLGVREVSLQRLEPVRSWGGPSWLAARPGAMPTRRRVQVSVVLGTAGAFLVADPLLGAVGAGVLVAAAAYVGLGRLEPRRLAAQRRQLVVDLPHALDLLEGCLAAGLPVRTAVSAVSVAVGGVVGERLDRVTSQVGVGFSDAEAWRSLSDDPVLGHVARDLARGCEAGSSLVPVIHEHAADARAAATAEIQRRARALGVTTAVPVAMCFLPAFFLVGVVPAIAGFLAPLLR